MRKCPGLVDSLVGYVGDSVEAGKQDDKVMKTLSLCSSFTLIIHYQSKKKKNIKTSQTKQKKSLKSGIMW